jgi:hypothetical protein
VKILLINQCLALIAIPQPQRSSIFEQQVDCWFLIGQLNLAIFRLKMVKPKFAFVCAVISSVLPSSSCEVGKPSSLDEVRLNLLKQLWQEPISSNYGGSGSNIPPGWRQMFQNLIDSHDTSNENDNEKREKLLDHISVRSSILLNYLPSDTEWTEFSNVSIADIMKYHVVFDESWNEEFVEKCLTVKNAAVELKQTIENISRDRSLTSNDDNEGQKGSSSILPTSSSHKERMYKLRHSWSEWPRTIVAVKDRISGEVTILDGNHRAILLAANSGDLTSSFSSSSKAMNGNLESNDCGSASLSHEAECASAGVVDPIPSSLTNTRVLMGYINAFEDNEKVWKFWRNC